MASSDLLHPSVRRRLDGLRTRLRGRLLYEGLAWLALAAVTAVFVTLGLDYALHFERGIRVALSAAAALALALIVWRTVIRPLGVPMDVSALTLLVEKRFGSLGDRLITAVEFSARPPAAWEGVSPAMIQQVGEEANRLAAVLDFREVVERPRMRRLGLLALSAAMLLTGFSVWQGGTMGRWFERSVLFADVDWPQDTYLHVVDGPDFRVVRGDDLEIVVEAEGAVPGEVLLHAKYPSGDKMEVRMEPASGAPRRFARKFPTVAESFSFYATGGDDELDRRRPHEVSVVDPPSLREVRFRVEHRPYMKRKADEMDQGAGILTVTPGSTLRLLEAVANKDLRRARLIVDDREQDARELEVYEIPVNGGGKAPRGVRGKLEIPTLNAGASRTLKIILTGADDTVNRRGQQFVVQVQPDLAPTVEIRKRAVSGVLTPKAYFPVKLQVKDDFGIAEANLAVTSRGKPRRDVRVDNLPADVEFQIEREIDIQNWGFAPGDVIQVFAEVRDNMPAEFVAPPLEGATQGAPGPNLAVSGMMEFRIVRPEELQDALVQRQKELRVEFAEAIVVQESSRAKDLAALQGAHAGAVGGTERNAMGEASKLQQSVGADVARAAETLAAVLEEMRYNRLEKPEDTAQMGQAIQALANLAKPILEVVGELAEESALTDAAALSDKLEATVQKQVGIRSAMEAALDLMVKIGTRQEVEKEVLKLIESSKGLHAEMEKEGKRPAEGLFTPTTTTKSATQPAGPDPASRP